MTKTAKPVFVAVVVAVLVLAATLGATLVLRQLRETAARQPAPSAPGPNPSTGPAQLCGQVECVKLTSVAMPQFKETVELLADGKGHFARLRITSDRGAVMFSSQIGTVTQHSITCEEGKTSACLLQGPDGDNTDLIGEVYTDDAGAWRQTPIPFSSDAGYLALRDVDGDGTPDVVTTQRRCSDDPPASCTKIAVAVFQLMGDPIGCTVTYATPPQLPGWPEVAPDASKLSACPS
ncbi:hypothetical protein [Kutzneria sp. CA-103260]|uniref:hypothetical protein n=1 Tax=Kutzneria sp. CA-103260 TaxID=2802641 RepID=UPI001BABB5BD|nr:hypothetical protein [Kutzneria sp. CA-103260]QUQ70885.1 hypothetical protein JJ691_86680 [Kutzneria sp. CA-103260]